jgi:nucleoside permease NupC
MNCTMMHGSMNVKKTSDLKNDSVTSILLTPYATIIGLPTLKGFIAATKIKVKLMKNCFIHWNVTHTSQST